MIKTPKIQVLQVRMEREGKTEILIQHDEPVEYLWKLLETESLARMVHI